MPRLFAICFLRLPLGWLHKKVAFFILRLNDMLQKHVKETTLWTLQGSVYLISSLGLWLYLLERTWVTSSGPGAVFPLQSVNVYAHGYMHESDLKARFLSCALQSVTLTEEKKGLLWHTQLEVSPGGVHKMHQHKHTHTHLKKTLRFLLLQAYAALMMRGRCHSMRGTIRVGDRRAKRDDSLVLTDNFSAYWVPYNQIANDLS